MSRYVPEQKVHLPEGDDNTRRMVGLLSNSEVYEFFKEVKEGNSQSGRHAKWKYNTHLNTVTYEVLQYLEQTPCIHQTPEQIENLLIKLAPFNLTKAERLTMLNTRPTQPVDIQAIVEESEERLTETQIEEILDIIEEALPVPTQMADGGTSDGSQE